MSLSTSSIASSISATPPKVDSPLFDSPELVELWKRSEYIRFSEHLRMVEEQQKLTLKKELLSVRKIEAKLKQKLVELENKERELTTSEINLKRTREEIMAKVKRLQEDHVSQVKILNEQHSSELKIEREKVRSEEIKRKTLESEIGKLRNNPASTNHHPNDQNERQLILLQSELEQALEREKILVQSREYFRNTVIKLATSSSSTSSAKVPDQIFNSSLTHTDCLLTKRAQLIDSGMYDETDPVIQQIDLKINTNST